MTRIAPNSVLPARRSAFTVATADGQTLVGEIAAPLHIEPVATLVCLHPLSTHGGSADSHLFRKAAWRLPALAGIAVVRFNFRGVAASLGASTGAFDSARGEGLDLGAVLAHVVGLDLPEVWLLGWSFGTDVALKHGDRDPVAGAVLLAPPLRWTTEADLDRWAGSGRPLVALVPEFDDFLRPEQARQRFARVPHAQVVTVPEGRHLFVGERYVRIVLDEVVARIAPLYSPVPHEWDGPMETWSQW
jgi:alpha/beta superfamily hydrolase